MDPLSILASSATLAHVIKKAFEIVKDIRHFKEEVAQLGTVLEFIEQLKRRIEKVGDSFLRTGSRESGELDPHVNKTSVLALLEQRLGEIAEIVCPRESHSKFVPERLPELLRRGKWHLDKKTIEEHMKQVDRYCAQIGLSVGLISYDTLTQVEAGQKEVLAGLKEIQAGQKVQHEESDRINRDHVTQWLSPFRFLARHQELSAECSPIGQHFLETEEFQAWEKGAKWQLHFFADKGAGKVCFVSINAMRTLVAVPDALRIPERRL